MGHDDLFLDIFNLGGVEGVLLLVNHVESLHKYSYSLTGNLLAEVS